MKNMNAAAVFVVLMSATNVFADSICLDINAEIHATKAIIAEATQEVGRFGELNAEIQTRLITNAEERKDDSMILGNGQPHLQEQSFLYQKSLASLRERILQGQASVEALKVQYMEQCSSYEKFD